MDEERLIILRKIETGDISVEDGMRILDAIEGRGFADDSPGEAAFTQQVENELDDVIVPVTAAQSVPAGSAVSTPSDLGDARWKTWAWVIFGLFVLLTVLSALWIVQGWVAHPWGWGFWLAWFPFLIGVLGMIGSYNARWVHVRIRQEPGQKPERIAISLPLPLGLIALILPLFSRWMPREVNGQDISAMVQDLNHNLSHKDPIHVQVNDKNGSQVEVYIG